MGADYIGYEDNSMESSLGYINIEPENEKIVFSVYSNSDDITQFHYVTFDQSWINNGFSLSDNSKFIAPFKGNYEFSFSGHMYNYSNRPNNLEINVELNGAAIHQF